MSSEHVGEPDWSRQRVFSTGEAAQICRVSQQTIIRCFDRGKLQGFRVPGSKFRRIPREELIRFMRDNDIPLSAIEGPVLRVLCVSGAGSAVSDLASALNEMDRVDSISVETGFDAGWALAKQRPHLVVLESGDRACTAEMIRARFDESDDPVQPRIVMVTQTDGLGGVSADPDSGVWTLRAAGDAGDLAAALVRAWEEPGDDG